MADYPNLLQSLLPALQRTSSASISTKNTCAYEMPYSVINLSHPQFYTASGGLSFFLFLSMLSWHSLIKYASPASNRPQSIFESGCV